VIDDPELTLGLELKRLADFGQIKKSEYHPDYKYK
jgi:hypothetical protein